MRVRKSVMNKLTIEQIVEDYDSKGISSPNESAFLESLNHHQEHLLKQWLEERAEINKFYSEDWRAIQDLADRI